MAVHYLIPPISNVSGSNVNIDATEFFESIEVGKGQLTVNIYNGFPIELRDMIYSKKIKIREQLLSRILS